jgi:hypothetical protein
MIRHRRRTRLTVVLAAALVLATAAAAACSARATVGASGSVPPDPELGAPTASGAATEASSAKAAERDLARVLAALAFMRAEPPTKPVVILLGGSAARECTISDASWREQIAAEGGPETLAWNMGSRNRTMAQNLAMVRALPRGAEALVYIGINLGAFTSAQKTARIRLPSPAPTAVALRQHHAYTAAQILSTEKKKALVRKWLAERYPVYERNFATGSGVLETLIRVCRERGYRPVLLELPRNSSVIGTSLSAPTARYRDTCRRLAAKYDVKWIPRLATLPNRDFYDLWHLVEPGREVWQGKLSAETAALLKLYGFDGGGS